MRIRSHFEGGNYCPAQTDSVELERRQEEKCSPDFYIVEQDVCVFSVEFTHLLFPIEIVLHSFCV